MSARDEAVLSAAERATLAGLETKAEADDPRLAAALRGGGRPRRSFQVSPGLVRASQTWVGPALFVAGLAVMILAISSLTALAALGALMIVGLLLGAGLVRSRVGGNVEVVAESHSHDQDHGEGLTNA